VPEEMMWHTKAGTVTVNRRLSSAVNV